MPLAPHNLASNCHLAAEATGFSKGIMSIQNFLSGLFFSFIFGGLLASEVTAQTLLPPLDESYGDPTTTYLPPLLEQPSEPPSTQIDSIDFCVNWDFADLEFQYFPQENICRGYTNCCSGSFCGLFEVTQYFGQCSVQLDLPSLPELDIAGTCDFATGAGTLSLSATFANGCLVNGYCSFGNGEVSGSCSASLFNTGTISCSATVTASGYSFDFQMGAAGIQLEYSQCGLWSELVPQLPNIELPIIPLTPMICPMYDPLNPGSQDPQFPFCIGIGINY